jgi:hypothetical protein
MDLQLVMWTNDISREVKFHLRYEKLVPLVAALGGLPQGRPNLESGDTTGESSGKEIENSRRYYSRKNSSHSQRKRN